MNKSRWFLNLFEQEVGDPEDYQIKIIKINNWTPEEINLLKSSGWNIYFKSAFTIYAEGVDYVGNDPSVDSTFPKEIYPGKIKEVKKLPGLLRASKDNKRLKPGQIPFEVMENKILDEVIRKRGSQWCVLGKGNGRSFGCYPSKKKAKERLRQIHYFRSQS